MLTKCNNLNINARRSAWTENGILSFVSFILIYKFPLIIVDSKINFYIIFCYIIYFSRKFFCKIIVDKLQRVDSAKTPTLLSRHSNAKSGKRISHIRPFVLASESRRKR